MLISRVPEEGAGRGEPAEAPGGQTASELFELMSKDHDFEAGDDPLTTSDLVLLYKNIDLGTQLMSNVRERPNQRVETVYHDETETDSDLGESCSSEELRNIMLANKERIDLFTNPPSLNSLCHKLGDLEIQVSNISNDLYDDRHFLNRDPYIKEQLQHLQLMSRTNEFNALLPASLLDYICCKRLEDNYNFYMDDIITYVKHTIDQLKRISNGDYLPEKVKKKWRESDPKSIENASKILTTSISMPLQVKQKTTGLTPVWDDIVHTEVDLRSLVKIMEKKIVLEVPRMISDSYKFFSRYRADKLVMSCSRRQSEGERPETKSRVDVVLTVQRAAAGQLVSNIHSIMVLQPEGQAARTDRPKMLPIEYQKPEQTDELIPKVIEVLEIEQNTGNRSSGQSDEFGSICSISDATDSKESDGKSKEDSDSSSTVPRPGSPSAMVQILTSAARVFRAEAASEHATPNDLTFSITTINPETSLPEQCTSDSVYAKPKKSPERVRIKSPYENKSFVIEERRRKKLLEVKERRERRKMASNENSKVAKHKAFPQAVSSVTKLSITNKAFYNSIYGQNGNGENGKRKSATSVNNGNTRKGEAKIDEEIEESDEDDDREGALPDRTLKNISKGHFLDDAETEMSYLQSKNDSDFLRISTSTSVNSNESVTNLCAQSECCSPLMSVKVTEQEPATPVEKQRVKLEVEVTKPQEAATKDCTTSSKVDNDKAPALECRRSLEKIFTLMKKLQQIETSENTKKKALANESRRLVSESGSSLKRRVSFSSPKLEKLSDRSEKAKERRDNSPTAAVPKVVISMKPHTKADDKNRNKPKPRVKHIPENPLKAISQLLHDIDNVQKSRPKIADPKAVNRSIATENEEVKLQKRRSRVGSPAVDEPRIPARVKTRFVREERPEVVKPQALEKKINDLIDEAKEARGEAVRGPPRFSSRLNALAQPKRTYVQALAEDLPKRQQAPERAPRPGSHYSRTRRRADRRLSPGSVRAPHSSLERTKPRRSAASSPEVRRVPPQFGTLAAAAADALNIKKKRPVEPAVGGHSVEHVAITRAPLLPCDVELSSGTSCATDDKSSSIGLKLHRMVDAMLHASRPSDMAVAGNDSSPSLVCNEELIETQISDEIFVENTDLEEIFTASSERNDRLENAHLITQVNSVTELLELEHALHRSLSSGAFGRPRVNKLTLSPRPSLQRVVMHQSGDTTLVLKSHLTQKIQVTCQSSDHKNDIMGLLSNTRLDCEFSGFPLQISTVGYAFPTFQCQIKNITSRILTDVVDTSEPGTSCTDSVETVLEIKAERGSADEERVTGQGNAADNTEGTAVSIVSAQTAGSGNKEVTAAATINKADSEPPDYTSSFDILVGLLNEIQKITTCGDDATNAQTLDSLSSESSPGDNTADHPSSSGDAVSNSCMSSDDPLGSFIQERKSVSAEAVELKPVCEDKEVLARVAPDQVAASTSQQADLTARIETSTGTDVLASSCSVSAFTHFEYSDVGCNTLIQSGDQITEQMGIETNRTSVKSLVPYYNNIFKVERKKDVTALTHSVATGTKRNVAAVCNILVDIAPVQKNKIILDKCEDVKIVNVNDKKEVNKFSLNVGEFDSTLKVKRDILVTFYSILVLTVFAALAFPEMLQFA